MDEIFIFFLNIFQFTITCQHNFSGLFHFIQYLIFICIREFAHMPADSDLVSLVAGYHMHMEVKYRLPCALFIVLHNIISVASEYVCHLCYHLL